MARQGHLALQAELLDTRLERSPRLSLTDDHHARIRPTWRHAGERLQQTTKALAIDQPPHRPQHRRCVQRQFQAHPGLLPRKRGSTEGDRVESTAQHRHRLLQITFKRVSQGLRHRRQRQLRRRKLLEQRPVGLAQARSTMK